MTTDAFHFLGNVFHVFIQWVFFVIRFLRRLLLGSTSCGSDGCCFRCPFHCFSSFIDLIGDHRFTGHGHFPSQITCRCSTSRRIFFFIFTFVFQWPRLALKEQTNDVRRPQQIEPTLAAWATDCCITLSMPSFDRRSARHCSMRFFRFCISSSSRRCSASCNATRDTRELNDREALVSVTLSMGSLAERGSGVAWLDEACDPLRSFSLVDEPSRVGDFDRVERWDLLLFFECLQERRWDEEWSRTTDYFFDGLPSRRCRSRLDERLERFLSRSLAERCDAERVAGDPSDEETLDERFLNETNKWNGSNQKSKERASHEERTNHTRRKTASSESSRVANEHIGAVIDLQERKETSFSVPMNRFQSLTGHRCCYSTIDAGSTTTARLKAERRPLLIPNRYYKKKARHRSERKRKQVEE